MNKRIRKKKEIEMLIKYNHKLFEKVLIKSKIDHKRFLNITARSCWRSYKEKGLNITKVINNEYTACALFRGIKETKRKGYPVYKKDAKDLYSIITLG